MKSKLTLSVDASLMNHINHKAKLNKNINLSKMVEKFLSEEFLSETKKPSHSISNLRGILKRSQVNKNWKQQKQQRLSKKYLK